MGDEIKGFKGLDQDSSFVHRDPNMYWDALNVRINLSDGNMFLSPILGNSKVIEFAGNVDIIGWQVISDYLYLFTTDNNGTDSIVEVDSDLNTNTLYTARLNFSIDAPIECVGNIENDSVWKIYWVDGVNQLRHINVKDPNLSTLDPTLLQAVGEFDMSQPKVGDRLDGGSLKAGMIQYGYALYNESGAQTRISPLSTLISIGGATTGGSPEEILNTSLQITIDNLDTRYANIRLYSVHYSSLDSVPEIKMILDEKLSGNSITYRDTGSSTISIISTDQFLAFGGQVLIPYTLATKKQRLFIANYKVDNFIVDFDSRAYGWSGLGGIARAKIKEADGTELTFDTLNYNVPEKHDCINVDPTHYYETFDGVASGITTYGRQGPNVKVLVTTTHVGDEEMLGNESKTAIYRGLKQGETYRIGIEFYNKFGITSPANWICDLTIPYFNRGLHVKLEDVYNIDVTINTAAVSGLLNQGVVGYRILRVERKVADRTIITQGFIVPTFQPQKFNSSPVVDGFIPYPHTKDIMTDTATYSGGNIFQDFKLNVDFEAGTSGHSYPDRKLVKQDDVCLLYTPDSEADINVQCDTVSIYGSARDSGTNSHSSLVRSKDYPTQLHKATDQLIRYGVGGYNCLSALGTSEEAGLYFSWNHDYGETYNDGITKTVKLKHDVELLKRGALGSTRNGVRVMNSVTVGDMTGGGSFGAGGKAGFSFTGSSAYVLRFEDTAWHERNGNAWESFRAPEHLERYIPIVELINSTNIQYGGATYESRQRNIYMKVGDYESLNVTSNVTKVGNGDIYLSNYSVNRINHDNNGVNVRHWHMLDNVNITLECNINEAYRYDSSYNLSDWDYFRLTNLTSKYMDEFMKFNRAYDNEAILSTSLAKPFNFRVVDDYKTKILGSDIKFNNELSDSWLTFKPSTSLELDGIYGEIIKLQELRGEIVSFQNKAIAHISILPRVQTTATDGKNIELGTGKVLQDYDYLTTTSGTLNKWGIAKDKQSIYYYDDINNTFNILQNIESEISTVTGLDSFFKSAIIGDVEKYNLNNPHKGQGVFTYYDNVNEDINISFLGDEDFQLVYNLLSKTFVTFRDPVSNIAIPFNNKLLTSKKDILYRLYQEYTNKPLNFFGAAKTMYVTFLASAEPLMNKIFNNILFQSDNDIPNRIRTWTTKQNSLEKDFDVKAKYNKYRGIIPREGNTRVRIAGTRAWIMLKYTGDKFLKLYDVVIKSSFKRP